MTNTHTKKSCFKRNCIHASGLLAWLGLAMMLVGAAPQAKGESYYTVPPLFSQAPSPKKATQPIDRFGPVGIGIELRQPAFRMRIRNVEGGSPAAATGKLKKGQWIDSINGRVLKDRDPRRILGDIIAEAEATDGVVKFVVRDKEDAPPQEVVVKIPVLGAYSDTWPRNCEKSDRIVRGLAEYLKETGANGMGLGTLFLMSTGDDSDLEFVRQRMQKLAEKNKDKKELSRYPWHIGYAGPALCEYYLRTGDKAILHTLQLYADHLRNIMYNDAWGGRGMTQFSYMAGGHMNAAGVHCVTFLLLAKQCGIDVDETTLQRSLRHFYRFAGRGNVSYGDGLPEGSFVDNGKTGGLAFTMAAAASLTPDGEDSVYAKARNISAFKSFYSTSWLLHGHTGGGIGEIWRGAAMGLLHEERPKQYQSFMDERAWFYDLSRRFDGSFGIIGGGRYDKPANWGIGMGLVYTIPRKTLRMTGAPKTEFCHSYQLPEPPWGTAADAAFYSMDAVPVPGKEPRDVASETLPEDSARPVLSRLRDPDVTVDTLLRYAYHPELGIREYALGRIKRRGLQDEVIRMLKSDDPRIRHAGMLALPKMDKQAIDLLIGMVENPEESWWVAMNAMNKLADVDPALLAPHVDRLTHWLKHDDWWLRKAAMNALTQLAADKRFYKDILPIIGDMVVNNTHAVALSPLGGIANALKNAEPEVQAYALEVLGQAYLEFPEVVKTPAGTDVPTAEPYLTSKLVRNMVRIPGGFDALYAVAKKRHPHQVLPHKDLYLDADVEHFGPELREEFKPIILNELIPQFVAKHRAGLLAEAEWKKPKRMSYIAVGAMDGSGWRDGLVDLYKKAGIDRYNWQFWGPAPDNMTWQYHSFDPPEKQLKGGWRYRDITLPEGMDNWFKPEFNAKKAGWRSGRAPFAYNRGKLAPIRRCAFTSDSRCGCGEEPHTLWEHEVLLMRTTVKLPPPDPRYRYRLVVGGMSHVGGGDGFAIYIDGERAIETKLGVGKRAGGQPVGFFIHKELADAFKDGKVQLAVKTFRDESGYIAVWFEKMLMPPLDETVLRKSAAAYPMVSTSYFAEKEEGDKYQWDGVFKPNPDVLGNWEVIDRVETIEDFKPDKKMDARRVPYRSLTLKDEGRTDDRLWMWSGDMLMDLRRNQAWKMKVETIDDVDYLFVEAGGVSWRTKAGWKPDWLVLKRK